MAGATHENTITSTLFLSPLPPARAGFGTVMLVVDKATNTLNGARTMTFNAVTEADSAEAAGYISATTLAFLTAAFTQSPAPATVKVGNQDTGATETLTAAITAIRAADDDWYCLCIYSRADALILLASAAIETTKKIFVAQSDDATWLTSGLPSGLTALAELERTAVVYHDDDTEPADIAWACSRMVFDPDFKSAGWEGQIRGVSALTTALTTAQRDLLIANNANVALPFSTADQYMSPGNNCNGRGIYEIISADWYEARCREDIAALKLARTAIGEKTPVTPLGQALISGVLENYAQQGESIGHFVKGQTRVTAFDITTADTAAERLRFKVEAQIAKDARLFDFTVYLSADALAAA